MRIFASNTNYALDASEINEDTFNKLDHIAVEASKYEYIISRSIVHHKDGPEFGPDYFHYPVTITELASGRRYYEVKTHISLVKKLLSNIKKQELAA